MACLFVCPLSRCVGPGAPAGGAPDLQEHGEGFLGQQLRTRARQAQERLSWKCLRGCDLEVRLGQGGGGALDGHMEPSSVCAPPCSPLLGSPAGERRWP